MSRPNNSRVEGAMPSTSAKAPVAAWILTCAWLALILDVEPLLYAAAWKFLPGVWVAAIPQTFPLAAALIGLGCLLGLMVVVMVIFRIVVGVNLSHAERFRLYLVALVSGFGVGCASAWLTYMLCWHT